MEKKDNLCFVIMPFSAKYDDLYENHLKRLVEHNLASVECFRVDEFHTAKKKKTQVIEEKIKDCRFAIADISEKNPNVYYEIGYARALDKTVILIKNKQIGKLPFDIKDLEVLIYDRDKIGYNDINKQILASLSNDFVDLIKPKYARPQCAQSDPIVGKWNGRYWVKKVEHSVTLYIEQDDEEKYTADCIINIVSKGKHYRIREILHYNQPLIGLDWRDGDWVEFIGTTYSNDDNNNRLDYWMDVYAINKDISNDSLCIKIWDNVNTEKQDVLFRKIT